VRIVRALDWNDRLQFVDATNAEARAFFAPSLTEAQVMVEMYVVDERQRLHGGFERGQPRPTRTMHRRTLLTKTV
jgi:hypothetical protein